MLACMKNSLITADVISMHHYINIVKCWSALGDLSKKKYPIEFFDINHNITYIVSVCSYKSEICQKKNI